MSNIVNSVHVTVLPASICSAVIGYSPFEFGNRIVHLLYSVYCSVIGPVTFTYCAAYFVTKLRNMPGSFADVVFLITDLATLVILTYYRIKFLSASNVVQSIFDT